MLGWQKQMAPVNLRAVASYREPEKLWPEVWSLIRANTGLPEGTAAPRPAAVEPRFEPAADDAMVIEPTTGHVAVLGRLLSGAGTAGNLVNDAHLAALALEHSAEIVSFDADFSRFVGVRWLPPA